MTPTRYRKKPVVVEAKQWQGGDSSVLDAFVGSQNWTRADARDVPWTHPDDGEQVVIWNELEQAWVPCPVGHWVICGVRREYYPCDPDVFAATYEPAEESQ